MASPWVLYEGEKGQTASYELASYLKELNICDAGLGPAGQAVLSNFRKIGLINFKGQEVEIRPKIPVTRILQLLDPDLKSFNHLSDEASLQQASEWTDALALFLDLQLSKALARGPLEGYVAMTEWTKTLRGRVEFSALATSGRFGSAEVLVTHDEYTTNIPENQLLRTAIEVLLATKSLASSRRNSLKVHAENLSGVELLDNWSRLPSINFEARTKHYHPALKTAHLILSGQSLNARGGLVRANSFLIDMAQLFEFFIDRKFSELATQTHYSFSSQYGTKHLDTSGIFKIRPDFMFFDGETPVGLADAKYKIVESKSDVPTSDVNQVIAYCTRFQLQEGHLIFAKSPEFSVQMVGDGLRLQVHELDLSASAEEVEAKLRFLWEAITLQM